MISGGFSLYSLHDRFDIGERHHVPRNEERPYPLLVPAMNVPPKYIVTSELGGVVGVAQSTARCVARYAGYPHIAKDVRAVVVLMVNGGISARHYDSAAEFARGGKKIMEPTVKQCGHLSGCDSSDSAPLLGIPISHGGES